MNTQFVIKILADGLVIPIIVIAVVALLFMVPRARRYTTYSTILLAGLSAYFVAKIFSLVYQPSELRPFEILGVDPGASYLNNPGFPSDHALFIAVLTLAVWYATRNKLVSGILLCLTLAVCLGRVLALVHTPLDVAGGLVAAAVGAVWYLKSQTHVAKSAKI